MPSEAADKKANSGLLASKGKGDSGCEAVLLQAASRRPRRTSLTVKSLYGSHTRAAAFEGAEETDRGGMV